MRVARFQASVLILLLLDAACGARLRSSARKSIRVVAAGELLTSKDTSATLLQPRKQSPVDGHAFEEEVVQQPLLDAALDKIDAWIESPRQADETGTLGMPPPGSSIIIDGPSVAWAHSQHKKFSTVGLRKVVDFFLDKGYPSVVALVSLTYSQEPPKNSPRTRVADDIDALLALRDAGHVHLVPPGASDDGMLLQYAWSQKAFVVSNNEFAEFKLQCSSEEEEWVRTHHIYFTWHDGHFLPTCDRDHRAPRDRFSSSAPNAASPVPDDAEERAAAEEEIQRCVAEAVPPFAWLPVGGVGLIRGLPTLSLFALLERRGWNRVDEHTLEALVQVLPNRHGRWVAFTWSRV